MELGSHIKGHRARLSMSQEQLAEAIFVSRQTISNWETDRTYPDVHSLLLLSDLFGVSVDDLIKGDVEEMKAVLTNEAKRLNRLGAVMAACGGAAVIWAVATALLDLIWPAILPGYYSDGRTWISIDLDADLSESLVLGLCDMSYGLVFSKLPKRVQREIAER